MPNNAIKPSIIKRHLLAFSIFFGFCTVVGGSLLFLIPEDDPVSGNDMAISAIGLLLFAAGDLGLLTVIFRAIETPIPKEILAGWEIQRMAGKQAYVRNFFLRGLPFVAIFIAFIVFSRLSDGEISQDFVLELTGFSACSLVVLYFAARRFWDYNESEHERFVNDQSKFD